jgi:ATP-dependent Clp protease ATP-binding subunit ClpB
MKIDNFTTKFQEALAAAQTEATKRSNPTIEPAHVLLATVQQDNSSIITILRSLKVNAATFTSDLTAILDKLPKVTAGSSNSQHNQQQHLQTSLLL